MHFSEKPLKLHHSLKTISSNLDPIHTNKSEVVVKINQ